MGAVPPTRSGAGAPTAITKTPNRIIAMRMDIHTGRTLRLRKNARARPHTANVIRTAMMTAALAGLMGRLRMRIAKETAVNTDVYKRQACGRVAHHVRLPIPRRGNPDQVLSPAFPAAVPPICDEACPVPDRASSNSH